MSAIGSKKVVYAALAGNLAIALTKVAAATWTGSSAMLSEAIHSAVDTCNQGLLLYGMRRAARPADRTHPFGHGMEIYFWAFIVALFIFGLGGAVSIYQGWHKFVSPEPIESAWVNLVVLGASAVFEGLAFRAAWRELRRRNPDAPALTAVHRSKDPSVFAVLLEDAAALIGLALAALGIGFAVLLDVPELDGAASIAIGGVLIVTAIFLARETLSLLTGEGASAQILADVRAVLTSDPRVAEIDELLSMHLGPTDILLAVSVNFRDELIAPEVEQAVYDISVQLERSHPELTRVFLRPVNRT